MKPAFRIIAADRDITAAVRDRVISIEVTDEAELKSDEVKIGLDYRPRDGRFIELPTVGTKLEIYLGYEGQGLQMVGRYTIDQIRFEGPVLTLDVTGRAAGMTDTFRTPTSRTWHNTTLGAITETIAKEHGYTPRLNASLASVPIAHEDQTAESPMAFLGRLTERLDAVAKPAAGFLILAPRGEVKAYDGRTLPVVTLRPDLLTKWEFQHNARDDAGQAGAAGGYQSVYWDRDAAQLEQVAAGTPPYTNVRFLTADRGDASGTAATAQNSSDRRKKTFSATMIGNPSVMAEARLSLVGFPPGMDADWAIKSVKHTINQRGFLTDIDAELYQPSQLNAADVSTFTP